MAAVCPAKTQGMERPRFATLKQSPQLATADLSQLVRLGCRCSGRAMLVCCKVLINLLRGWSSQHLCDVACQGFADMLWCWHSTTASSASNEVDCIRQPGLWYNYTEDVNARQRHRDLPSRHSAARAQCMRSSDAKQHAMHSSRRLLGSEIPRASPPPQKTPQGRPRPQTQRRPPHTQHYP
jgi:hypothetical protein